VSRYLHLNPVRAGIVKRPEEYIWSSYPAYIGRRKEGWLTCDWILGQYSRDKANAKTLYRAFINEGLTLKENPFDELKAGLMLGSERFIEEIKKKTKLKKHREIPESKKLTSGIKYEDVIVAVFKRFRTREQDILEPGRRDNLSRKISLYLLRRHTDIRNEDIGRYFGIGYTAVSQMASRLKREMEEDRGLKKTVKEIEKGLLSEE
jgi:hypothetical protein